MLHTQGPGINDYNQNLGDPVTREGNWWEERALLEKTGQNRGFTDKPNDTRTFLPLLLPLPNKLNVVFTSGLPSLLLLIAVNRNINHTKSTPDWSTSTGAVHSNVPHDPVLSQTRPAQQFQSKTALLVALSTHTHTHTLSTHTLSTH